MKIFHNPRCRKSRAGLQYLQEKSDNIEIIEYVKNGLTEDNLREILLKLHREPNELIRKQEPVFKKELKNKEFTTEEWIKIIIENPKLLQRPIVLTDTKGVIADPPQNLDELNL